MAQLVKQWRERAAALEEKLGRPPTEQEVARALHVRDRQLKIIRKALKVYNAEQWTGQTDPDWSLDQIASGGKEVGPEESVDRADALHHVLHLLDELPRREASVLRLRYGLQGEKPLTLKDIGARLHLTRERVRQIETQALKMLQKRIVDSN